MGERLSGLWVKVKGPSIGEPVPVVILSCYARLRSRLRQMDTIVDWVTSHLPWCSYARAKMADGMEVDVASVLSAAEKVAEGKFKSIDVKKDIDPELDVGNLLAIDLQPIDLRELRWV